MLRRKRHIFGVTQQFTSEQRIRRDVAGRHRCDQRASIEPEPDTEQRGIRLEQAGTGSDLPRIDSFLQLHVLWQHDFRSWCERIRCIWREDLQ